MNYFNQLLFAWMVGLAGWEGFDILRWEACPVLLQAAHRAEGQINDYSLVMIAW